MIKNIWNYRYLLKRLALTDFKIRYKNSVLGFFWSLLDPLLMLLVLYFVFSNISPDVETNYHIFLLIGIVSWNFFSRGTAMGLNSIIGKPSLIKQVYVPRELLVLSGSITALMMTVLEFLIVLALMIVSNITPSIAILYFPVIIVIHFILVFGTSLALSALNTYFRDVQWIWGLIIQIGFFASGIFFKISSFPEHIKPILLLNPMARIIDMTRQTLLYNTIPPLQDWGYMIVSSVFLLVIGYCIFNRLEPGFAEEV